MGRVLPQAKRAPRCTALCMVCSVFSRPGLSQAKKSQVRSKPGAERSRFPAWLGQKGALLNWVDLTGLESLRLTQAGAACKWGSAAAARAPVQPIRDLGNCLTVSQWVVMGFSNPELTRRSWGVGRIVLTPPFLLEGMESVWHFFCIRSGDPDFWLLG